MKGFYFLSIAWGNMGHGGGEGEEAGAPSSWGEMDETVSPSSTSLCVHA